MRVTPRGTRRYPIFLRASGLEGVEAPTFAPTVTVLVEGRFSKGPV